MGKLVKNHWARLIVLVAGTYQVAAGIHGIFWPKLFWDFLTTNLDGAVRPVPILQTLNIIFGAFALALEWPLPIFITASKLCDPQGSSRSKGMSPDARKNRQNASTTDHTPGAWTRFLAGLHGSIEARLLIYPLSALAALLLYQGTNAGLYYLIGMGVYFWAFAEGETIMGAPWQLPKRRNSGPVGMMKV